MAFTYTQITALANKLIIDKLDPGIFSAESICKDARSMQVLEDGGTSITCPIITVDDTGSVGGHYASGDALSLQAVDVISSAEVDWRHVYESMVVTKPDLAKAGDSERRQVNLLNGKLKAMQLAFKQRITKSLLSDGSADGTATNGSRFDGLEALIQATGSYAGIAPADLSQWAAIRDHNSGSDRSLTLAIFDSVQAQTIEGDLQGATHAYCRAQVFAKFKGLLNTYQRTAAEESLSGFGHKGSRLEYAGLKVCVENQVSANLMYLVDMENWKLHVQKDNNMRKQSIKDLETQDALVERVFLYANAISGSRRAHGRIEDISE